MSSYIETFEQELIAKLNGNEDEGAIVRWVSEKVLESYRNGITAGQKGRYGDSQGAEPPPRLLSGTGGRLVHGFIISQLRHHDQLLHRAIAEVLAWTDCDDAERFADAFASRDWHCPIAPCTGATGAMFAPRTGNANESALWDGNRLFSVYHDRKGVKFWIITEADRNTTTVLLPDDY